MKLLLASLVVLLMATAAAAGGAPYIAIVGNDKSANLFYLDPEYRQFLYGPEDTVLSGSAFTSEAFTAPGLIDGPEVCDTQGTRSNGVNTDRGNKNARLAAGNPGTYTWTVVLPKEPSQEINLLLRCGVLRPNSFGALGYEAVKVCAAETGERPGRDVCARQPVSPGVSSVVTAALPKITAVAIPGPHNSFTRFNLTAFKNPSAYTLVFDAVTGAMANSNSQVLDGSANTRILLKVCMDKTIVVKLPVAGQVNALNQTEAELVAGDRIKVTMTIPRQNTMDIYCHAESLKVMGVAEDLNPF